MTADAHPAIRDNAAAHRFEMIVDGHAAVATYSIEGDTITFIHTVVPRAQGGRHSLRCSESDSARVALPPYWGWWRGRRAPMIPGLAAGRGFGVRASIRLS